MDIVHEISCFKYHFLSTNIQVGITIVFLTKSKLEQVLLG